MRKSVVFLGIGTLAVALIIYTVQRDKQMWEEARLEQDREWESFAQRSAGAIKARPLSSVEKKDWGLPHVKPDRSERSPASIPPKDSKVPRYQGHKVFGLPEGRSAEDMSFKNSPSPYWKKKLARRLLRFQEEGTEVFIRKEERLIYVTEGQAEWVEKVAIAYKRPDGLQTSYRALVDSSSGKVYKTWDRSIIEDFKRQFKKRPFVLHVDSL